MSSYQLSPAEARRIALAAQGFHRPRPRGPIGIRHVRDTIRQLGLVQLDFVNVLTPAHYQVLFSRLGPYQKAHLHNLIYRRREFTEQWGHEASILPIESWPLLRHRMATHRVRPYPFAKFLAEHPDYAAWVLKQVRDRGPLAAEELRPPDGVDRRLAQMWAGTVPRAALDVHGPWLGTVPRATLEAHFGRGLLAVADRHADSSRVYDLAERVVPSNHYGREVERDEAERELLRQAARANGIGTAADLADYFRMPVREARPRLAELAEAGELRIVRVDGWREPAYLNPRANIPKRIEASALLSPFDPLIWYRPRAQRLFDFEYRFEIYVPAEKRRWGCYVLPFLQGERLTARVDLKADREGRRLLVMAAYKERDAAPKPTATALAEELRTLAAWLELDAIKVERRGDLAKSLTVALSRASG
jgi:uncharacterized protein YcaQ